MKNTLISQLIFATIISYSVGLFKAKAQVISCENIKKIVDIIATDTNLTALKGGVAKEKEGKNSAIYYVQTSIWQSVDDNRGDEIIYDYEKQSYIVSGKIWGYVNLSNEYKVVVDSFTTALGQSWISKVNTGPKADSSTIFRNPQTFVVVAIKKTSQEITIECYYDKKHNATICISGDCDNYWAKNEHFNFDTYAGTFINGVPCGKGTLKQYATDIQYDGSILEGKPAGYGLIYNRTVSMMKSGFFFNGDTVAIDKSKKGCQYGDCENGLGLQVIFNYMSNEFSGIYIGYFNNGLKNGLGEIIEGERGHEKTFFGYFKNGMRDGQGVEFDESGTTFGSYTTDQIGKHETELPNDTSIQYAGNFNYSKTSYFDNQNILFRSGYNSIGLSGNKFRFLESTDADYMKLLETVNSIKEIYKYRDDSYKEITEKPKVVSTKQSNNYIFKSTLKFLKIYKTNIVNALTDSAYVLIDLNGSSINRLDWIRQYNKYYFQLKKIFGSRWKILFDTGVAEFKKKSSVLIFQYIYDKTKTVKLIFDLQGVGIEIR